MSEILSVMVIRECSKRDIVERGGQYVCRECHANTWRKPENLNHRPLHEAIPFVDFITALRQEIPQ